MTEEQFLEQFKRNTFNEEEVTECFEDGSYMLVGGPLVSQTECALELRTDIDITKLAQNAEELQQRAGFNF